MENNRLQKTLGYILLLLLVIIFVLIGVCFGTFKPAFGFGALYCGLMLFNIIFTTLTNALIVRGESILPDSSIWRLVLILLTSVFFALYCAL